MKSSAFIAACGAILCAASPILQGRKLYVKTDTVIEWVTVTVTEGDIPTTFRRPVQPPKPTTTSISSSETPPPPPPPPPSTSEAVIQQPPEPTPEPTTAPAPAPPPPVVKAPEPSPDPAPAPKPDPDPAPAPKPDPTPSEPADVAQPSDYISTALYHHNVHRFNHSVDALEWSDEHAGYAQQLAATCKFAHDTDIGGGGYGQNLAMWGSSGNAKAVGAEASLARGVSDGWYNNELEDFPSSDYGKGSPNMDQFSKWGHYSQMIWKGTKQVGCATQFCEPGTMNSMGSWYTVCNYYPAGNMGGAYDTNVFPPQGQPVIKAVQK